MSALRAIQLMGVAAIGALTGLACLNNLMDYNSNFALVQHVLSMDTTFPEGTLRWRAITSPAVHHAAYWLIIAAEGLAGALCLAGAYKMLLARNAGTDIFKQSKNVALWGLGIALALYLVGFMVIGAEWFAMWQSQRWDGRQPALRIPMRMSVGIMMGLPEEEHCPTRLVHAACCFVTNRRRERAAGPSPIIINLWERSAAPN